MEYEKIRMKNMLFIVVICLNPCFNGIRKNLKGEANLAQEYVS